MPWLHFVRKEGQGTKIHTSANNFGSRHGKLGCRHLASCNIQLLFQQRIWSVARCV